LELLESKGGGTGVRVAFEVGNGNNTGEWDRLAFFAGGPFVALVLGGAVVGAPERVFQNLSIMFEE
tara:strand:- start:218 stop:415 length:198 start_codon:yes stop_codon:yes gene_type:complete